MTAVPFSTIAQPNPGGVLFIEIPERIVRKLGAGRRVPVRVTLNGAKYRSTIAGYGGRYFLPARKELREAAKLAPGGRARVSLEVETAPRTVAVPAELARALSDADPAPKGIRRLVSSAKRAETRSAHILKVVARVRAKARAVSLRYRSTEHRMS
jgi:hypothetical protein